MSFLLRTPGVAACLLLWADHADGLTVLHVPLLLGRVVAVGVKLCPVQLLERLARRKY